MNTAEQVASELQNRIANLCSFDVGPLKEEMDSLCDALNQNPAACQLLLDEDIALCVEAIMKIQGKFQQEQKEKKPRASAKKKETLSPADLIALMNDKDLDLS